MTQTADTAIEFYPISGATTPLTFSHHLEANTDIKVYENGAEQTLGADYTVAAISGDYANGATVTPVAATVGSVWTIVRDTPVDQDSNLPAAHSASEAGLDAAIRRMQDIAVKVSRSLQWPLKLDKSTPYLPEPSAGKTLGWNSAADALENKTVSDIDTAVFPSTANRYIRNNASGDPDVLTAQESANLDELKAVNPGTTGLALLADETAGDARNELDTAPYVATRTALKALDTTKDKAAYLTESGREGTFVWRSGDYSSEITADTQEGIYIKADAIASTSGAWVRQAGWMVEGIDPRWYGAAFDNSTDDVTAIQAAIDAPPSLGGKVVIPGRCVIGSALVIDRSDITIQGLGYNGSRITQSSTTADIITVGLGVSTRQNIRIEKLSLTYSSTATSGAAINCHKIRSLLIEGVHVGSAKAGINLRDVSIAWVNGVQLRDLSNNNGVGIDIWDGVENEININNLLMDAAEGAETTRGVRIREGSVTRLNGCDIMHCWIGIEIIPDATKNVGWVFITDTFSDNCPNIGMHVSAASGTSIDQIVAKGLFITNGDDNALFTNGAGTINRLTFVQCGFNNNTGRGARLEGTGTNGPWKFIGCSMLSNFQGLRLYNSPDSLLVEGCHIAGNSAGGLSIAGSIAANAHIENNDVLDNGSHGVSIDADTTGFQIRGNRVTGSGARGVSIATGASDRYIIKDNIVRSNTSGQIVDDGSGTNKFVSDNIVT